MRSRALLSGIAEAHVGDALSHGREGGFNCISADRLAGLSTWALPVMEAEDKEATDLVVVRSGVLEAGVKLVFLAEGQPALEG